MRKLDSKIVSHSHRVLMISAVEPQNKMKLPIKKKWFDMIKSGEKDIEWRDAHITFVCEETGETLKKEIINSFVRKKEQLKDFTKKELEELFEDENLIGFVLNQ